MHIDEESNHEPTPNDFETIDDSAWRCRRAHVCAARVSADQSAGELAEAGRALGRRVTVAKRCAGSGQRPADIRGQGGTISGRCCICGRWLRVTPRSEVLFWHYRVRRAAAPTVVDCAG